MEGPESSIWRLSLYLAITVLGIGVIQCLRAWWNLRHVPGPRFAAITDLLRMWWVTTGRAHCYYDEIHKKYGSVVRLGPHMVSVSDPEALSIIYPLRPGIPKGDFYATLRPYTKERGSMLAVFNTQDEKMHKLIKTPIGPLFSLSNVVAFEHLVDKTLMLLSEQLEKRFVANNQALNLGEWLQYFAFESMGTMSFSKTYGFIEQGKDVDGMLDAIFQFMKTAAPMTQVPWLDKLLYKNRLAHAFRRTPGMSIMSIVGKVISDRRRQQESLTEGEKVTGHDDFLARFLEIHAANPDLPPWIGLCRKYHADSDVYTEVHLLSNPLSMEELRNELDHADLSFPYPQFDNLRGLLYLDACVQEAARMHPPFALPFERVVPKGGITVLGYYLPADTLVAGNPYVVNRHEATFGFDVDSWRPRRWLVDDPQHRQRMEQSLLTFGHGRRICLGKNIGILEVKKLIAFLVVNYDIEMQQSERAVENFFFFKQTGLRVRLHKRVR